MTALIPHHGGPDENDPNNWLTVSYASPFRGQTRQRTDLNWYIDSSVDFSKTNGTIQENSFQSYGFWFVPPDLNGRVLCFFANGDPSQGYWTACIQDSMDAHMVPGIGAVTKATANGPNALGYIWRPTAENDVPAIPTHTALQKYIQITDGTNSEVPYRLPVCEPVIVNQSNSNPSTPRTVLMVPNVYQTLQLGLQGLAFDFIRGSTSASSVRENPSQVFGISTPGRLTSFANINLSQSILSKLDDVINAGQNQNSSESQEVSNALECTYRTGGHQFVMDDGSIEGYDQGIRIRTTGGNEILLDDTNGQIYIINGPGTAWVELAPSGRIDIFASNDFSIRSQGNINFHADKNINLNANLNIKLHSNNDTRIDTSGNLIVRSLGSATHYSQTGDFTIGTAGAFRVSGANATINSTSQFYVQATDIQLPGSAKIVKDPGFLSISTFQDVNKISGTETWWQSGTIQSIVNRVPTHEPWANHEINGIKTASVSASTSSTVQTRTVYPQSNSTVSGVAGTLRGAPMTFMQAIARIEGYGIANVHPTRDNNPGDIIAGNFTLQHGQEGVDGRFAVFPNADEGYAALRALLQKHYAGLTVAQAINKYAPPSENNTNNYIQSVCASTGLTPSTILTSENIG